MSKESSLQRSQSLSKSGVASIFLLSWKSKGWIEHEGWVKSRGQGFLFAGYSVGDQLRGSPDNALQLAVCRSLTKDVAA